MSIEIDEEELSETIQETKNALINSIKFLLKSSDSYIKKILDIIYDLIKNSKITIEPFTPGGGFGIGISTSYFNTITKDIEPQIEKSMVSELMSLISSFLHNLEEHVNEKSDFVGDMCELTFKKDDVDFEKNKQFLKEKLDLIQSHDIYKILVFKFLREKNYLIDSVDIKQSSYESMGTKKNIEYYDLRIKYASNPLGSSMVRFEIDRFELEALISTLAKALNKK